MKIIRLDGPSEFERLAAEVVARGSRPGATPRERALMDVALVMQEQLTSLVAESPPPSRVSWWRRLLFWLSPRKGLSR